MIRALTDDAVRCGVHHRDLHIRCVLTRGHRHTDSTPHRARAWASTTWIEWR